MKRLSFFGADRKSKEFESVEKRLSYYDDRLEAAFEAADFAKECDLRRQQIALLTRLWGESDALVRQKTASLESAERVLALAPEQQAAIRQSRLAYAKGKQRFYRGDQEAGLRLLEEAYEIHRRIFDDQELPTSAWLLNELAKARRAAGDVDGALELYRRAAPMVRELFGETDPYYGASLLMIAQEDVRDPTDLEAEGLLRQALSIFEINGAPTWQLLGCAHLQMAELYYARTRYEDARIHAQQAEALLTRYLPDQFIACILTYLELGRVQKALECHEEASRAFRRAADIIDAFGYVPDEKAHREILTECATVLRKLNKPDEALVYERRAAALPSGD